MAMQANTVYRVIGAIEARHDFRESSMSGERATPDHTPFAMLGRLPQGWRERYQSDRPIYVVYSYATPIAWVTEHGDPVVPDVTHSVTTSPHQTTAAVALLGRGTRRTMLTVRSLSEIAGEITADWGGKISPHAEPYLNAMHDLHKITDTYGHDSAESVVLYFLSNANGWRGDTARRVKQELRDMIKNYA